jgi:N-acetylated-alpha-linked acidic dipeptidase
LGRNTESEIIKQAGLETAWELVETFSGMPRWRPDDVNMAGDLIADRLRTLGVPVTVHRPRVYLSVPQDASVTAGDVTHRAKPPSSAAHCPDGVTGELVYVPSQKASLRSYTKDAIAFLAMREPILGAASRVGFC